MDSKALPKWPPLLPTECLATGSRQRVVLLVPICSSFFHPRGYAFSGLPASPSLDKILTILNLSQFMLLFSTRPHLLLSAYLGTVSSDPLRTLLNQPSSICQFNVFNYIIQSQYHFSLHVCLSHIPEPSSRPIAGIDFRTKREYKEAISP